LNEVQEQKPDANTLPTSKLGAWLDEFAYQVNPAWGARRVLARQAYQHANRIQQRYFSRAYDGAGVDHKRGKNWIASRLSPDSALEQDLDTLRRRSRDLTRNNCYAAGAIDSFVDNVVGAGLTPQPRLDFERLGISEEAAETISDELEEVFDQWQHGCDPTGTLAFFEQVRLAARNWAELGEAFLVFSDQSSAERPIPLVLEVIEPDRVETPPHLSGSKSVRLGIERDDRGKIVAYWIRTTHPGDTVDVDFRYERVPANRVRHLFTVHYAGQSRGVPWLTPSMNKLKDVADYDEAAVIAAQTEACFAGIVTTNNSQTMAINTSTGQTAAGIRTQEIQPGMINYLDLSQGQDIKFATPNKPGGQYGPFLEVSLRAVASGINWCYELLAKTWGRANYSSVRAAMLEVRNTVKARQRILISRVLCAVWQKIVEEAVIVGACSIDPTAFKDDPWPWFAHKWVAPGWGWIDPVKEIAAARNAIEANLSTYEIEIGAQGGDWYDVFCQREREKRVAEDKEIVPGPAPGAGGTADGNPSDPDAQAVDADGEPVEDPADAEAVPA